MEEDLELVRRFLTALNDSGHSKSNLLAVNIVYDLCSKSEPLKAV